MVHFASIRTWKIYLFFVGNSNNGFQAKYKMAKNADDYSKKRTSSPSPQYQFDILEWKSASRTNESIFPFFKRWAYFTLKDSSGSTTIARAQCFCAPIIGPTIFFSVFFLTLHFFCQRHRKNNPIKKKTM